MRHSVSKIFYLSNLPLSALVRAPAPLGVLKHSSLCFSSHSQSCSCFSLLYKVIAKSSLRETFCPRFLTHILQIFLHNRDVHCPLLRSVGAVTTVLATRDFQSWTYFCKEATYPGFLIVMQGILLILILLGVDLTVLARRIENLFCSDGFVNMKANHINQFIQVQYGVHLGPCAASLLFTFPPHSRIMSPFVLFGDKTFPICSLRIISAGGFFWFNEVVLSIHR